MASSSSSLVGVLVADHVDGGILVEGGVRRVRSRSIGP